MITKYIHQNVDKWKSMPQAGHDQPHYRGSFTDFRAELERILKRAHPLAEQCLDKAVK